MPVAIILPDPRSWPDALRRIPARRLADGRRVVASQDLAALLGCGPANLRQMAAAGRLRREHDLDEPRRSWYTVEEAARAYLTKFPGAALDGEDDALHARLWPDMDARAEPPTRPVEILPELLAAEAAQEAADRDRAEAARPAQDTPAGRAEGNKDALIDRDALIARLAADLLGKDEELRRLRAELAERSPRRGQLQRRPPPRP